jgi:DNA-binding Lrp family transcriptional regulator
MEDGLPLTASPFSETADRLGVPVAMALSMARRLLGCGLIRRFGVFWDFRQLGLKGYLFGVKAPADYLDGVASWINGFDFVTHNYARRHDLNLWFTAILPGDDAAVLLGALLAKKNLPFVSLGVRKMIKLRPSFAGEIERSLNGGGSLCASAAPAGQKTFSRRLASSHLPIMEGDETPKFACLREADNLTPLWIKIIAALQDDLEITERPFAGVASLLKLEEDVLIGELARMKSSGILRRLGASVAHGRAGCAANSLMAWSFSGSSEDRIVKAAEDAVRGLDWASHCYLRYVVSSSLPAKWPYNLFVMIHARDGADLADREESMAGAFAAADFLSMHTEKEYKKIQYRLTV